MQVQRDWNAWTLISLVDERLLKEFSILSVLQAMGRIYTTRTGAGMLSAKGIMECFILFSCLVGTDVFAAFLMCDLSHISFFFFFSPGNSCCGAEWICRVDLLMLPVNWVFFFQHIGLSSKKMLLELNIFGKGVGVNMFFVWLYLQHCRGQKLVTQGLLCSVLSDCSTRNEKALTVLVALFVSSELKHWIMIETL